VGDAKFPAWISQPMPDAPPSPTHRHILDAYCAELEIDARVAQLSFMNFMEAVRWWNSGAPELYKGPTAASEALAKWRAFPGSCESEDGVRYEAMLRRQDREERLARVLPDAARPGWRAPRSQHAPAVEV
jgi:hypothetical protein